MEKWMWGLSPRFVTVLWHQAVLAELAGDIVDGTDGVVLDLGACADELSGSEQEDDDLGVIEPEDETGELLGLVLDPLESEGDGDGVEVELVTEVGRCDHVLDVDLGLDGDVDSDSLEILYDLGDGPLDVLAGLSTGAYELSALEEQGSGLGFGDPVDQTGELFGIVLSSLERIENLEKIQFGSQGTGSYDVLYVNGGHAPSDIDGLYKAL